MPYTPAQRRLFHAVEEDPEVAHEHGMSRKEGKKLADEADRLAREGKEKKASAGGDGFIDLRSAYDGFSSGTA